MKKSHIIILAILVFLVLPLSACTTGPRVTNSPGVGLAEDLAVVSVGPHVYGVDMNGAEVWRYPEKASNKVVFYAPPLIVDGYVYVGDLANTFHKIDLETGEAKWVFSDAKGIFIGKAALVEGVVYAPSNDGNLYAIDDTDGKALWVFPTDHYLWGQPQVDEEHIYVGSMDNFVYAINKENGSEAWSFEMSGAVVGAVALNVDEGLVYAGSIGKRLVAIDTQTGKEKWGYDAQTSIWSTPLLNEETVYFGDSAGDLYALDAQTGQLVWKKNASGHIVGGLVPFESGFVLTTEEGTLSYFDFDGNLVWSQPLDGEIYQSPAVNDDLVLVGTIKDDALAYAYKANGGFNWSFTPNK